MTAYRFYASACNFSSKPAKYTCTRHVHVQPKHWLVIVFLVFCTHRRDCNAELRYSTTLLSLNLIKNLIELFK